MKMYKEGKECDADRDQVDLMKGAGWSLAAPKAGEDSETDSETETEGGGDSPGPMG